MRRFALLLFVVACKKSAPPPSCNQIVDHALALMGQVQAQGPAKNHDEMDLSSKKPMVQLCVQRHLTEEQARCMLDAKTLDVLNACRPVPADAAAKARLPNVGSGSGSGSATKASGSGSGSGSGSTP